MNKIFQNWKVILGISLGAVIGFGYYYFIGCNSGTCPLTSKPLPSTAWGAVIGLVWTFPDSKKEKK